MQIIPQKRKKRPFELFNSSKEAWHFSFNSYFVLVQFSTQDKWQWVLKLYWSDFHLSSLGGVVMSFPRIPIDSISIWRVLPMMINTIQVWCMTTCVPPSSFEFHSTVTAPGVIVLIFGCEERTTMPRERITCSTWNRKREKSEGKAITISRWRQNSEATLKASTVSIW